VEELVKGTNFPDTMAADEKDAIVTMVQDSVGKYISALGGNGDEDTCGEVIGEAVSYAVDKTELMDAYKMGEELSEIGLSCNKNPAELAEVVVQFTHDYMVALHEERGFHREPDAYCINRLRSMQDDGTIPYLGIANAIYNYKEDGLWPSYTEGKGLYYRAYINDYGNLAIECPSSYYFPEYSGSFKDPNRMQLMMHRLMQSQIIDESLKAEWESLENYTSPDQAVKMANYKMKQIELGLIAVHENFFQNLYQKEIAPLMGISQVYSSGLANANTRLGLVTQKAAQLQQDAKQAEDAKNDADTQQAERDEALNALVSSQELYVQATEQASWLPFSKCCPIIQATTLRGWMTS
jgi:hypothetical protein